MPLKNKQINLCRSLINLFGYRWNPSVRKYAFFEIVCNKMKYVKFDGAYLKLKHRVQIQASVVAFTLHTKGRNTCF